MQENVCEIPKVQPTQWYGYVSRSGKACAQMRAGDANARDESNANLNANAQDLNQVQVEIQMCGS